MNLWGRDYTLVLYITGESIKEKFVPGCSTQIANQGVDPTLSQQGPNTHQGFPFMMNQVYKYI